ncbi:MAG: ABC transporter permease [Candidatus Bathyarchaeia archaeon]
MSKLFGFRYLHFRRLIVLVLILSLVSTLFLLTAQSFLGFYNSFNAYLGEEGDIVAVYDRQSRTPFTGSIPAYLSIPLSQVKGVLVCSPETITPCIISNQTVFVRGVLPEIFFQMTTAEFVDGEILSQTGFEFAMLGKNVADRLGLRVGEGFLVFSSLADKYLQLKVCGVFVSGSVMDDEVLVLLNVGQWLRFADYNRVTLIRTKINPDILTAADVYQELAKSAQNSQPQTTSSASTNSSSNKYANYQNIISWAPIKFNIGQLSVSGTQNLMKSYLDRYGVTKEALSMLSIIVFLLCSVTVVAATQTLISQHKTELETLRYLGASRRLLKFDVFLKLLPVSLVACGLGAFLSYVLLGWLNSGGFLRVLAHGLTLSFDPLLFGLSFVLVWLLVSVAVLRSGF